MQGVFRDSRLLSETSQAAEIYLIRTRTYHKVIGTKCVIVVQMKCYGSTQKIYDFKMGGFGETGGRIQSESRENHKQK